MLEYNLKSHRSAILSLIRANNRLLSEPHRSNTENLCGLCNQAQGFFPSSFSAMSGARPNSIPERLSHQARDPPRSKGRNNFKNGTTRSGKLKIFTGNELGQATNSTLELLPTMSSIASRSRGGHTHTTRQGVFRTIARIAQPKAICAPPNVRASSINTSAKSWSS